MVVQSCFIDSTCLKYGFERELFGMQSEVKTSAFPTGALRAAPPSASLNTAQEVAIASVSAATMSVWLVHQSPAVAHRAAL